MNISKIFFLVLIILVSFTCSKNPTEPDSGQSPVIVYSDIQGNIFKINNIYKPEPVQITFSGMNHYPKISPDGTKIAYLCHRSNEFDPTNTYAEALYMIDITGENDKFLTVTKKYNQPSIIGLSWSPDGSRIAFVSPLDGAANDQNVWVIDADGENKKKLTDGGWNLDPRWSPDGEKIAFLKPDFATGLLKIHIVDSFTGTDFGFHDITSTLCLFSPNNIHIVLSSGAYNDNNEYHSELFLTDVAGQSDIKQITFDNNTRINLPIGFSSNGDKIYFISPIEADYYLSTSEISVIDIDGKNRKVLRTVDNIGKAKMSPDGSKILLFIWQVESSPKLYSLYVLSTDGKEYFKVAEDVRFPDWG